MQAALTVDEDVPVGSWDQEISSQHIVQALVPGSGPDNMLAQVADVLATLPPSSPSSSVSDQTELADSLPNGHDIDVLRHLLATRLEPFANVAARLQAGVSILHSLPIAQRSQARFILLQQWEGYVETKKADSFVARLVDLDNPVEREVEADILLSEVNPDDLDLIKPGAVFYWTIGYRDQATGQRARVSEIRFRRLPAFTENDLDVAKRDAQQTAELLGWE
jgi:hypothetical protein